jgi:hypothetical protein
VIRNNNSCHPAGVSIILTHEGSTSVLDRFLYTFLLNNSHYPFEFLLINSKDKDNLKPLLKKYSKHVFIYKLQNNTVASATKNKAALKALYPYLLFIDSSIVYSYDILPKALEQLLNPKNGIVGARIDRYPPIKLYNVKDTIHAGITCRWNFRSDLLEPEVISYQNYPALPTTQNNPCPAVSGAFLFCRRADFLALNGFKEVEDLSQAETEFCLRLFSETGKLCLSLSEKPLHLSAADRLEISDLAKNIDTPAEKPACADQTTNLAHYAYEGKVAVICHIFYSEQWPQIKKLLDNIPPAFQLFITLSENFNSNLPDLLLKDFPTAKISYHPNRGKDIAPFLHLITEVISGGYEVLLKIHTKRDHHLYGASWRKLMLQAVVGSPGIVKAILNSFAENESLGTVGPKLLYKSIRGHLNGNLNNLRTIWNMLSPSEVLPGQWGFFAGTCFWCRPQALLPLCNLNSLFAYKEDNNIIDGQTAHAIERLFGLIYLQAKHSFGLITLKPGFLEPAEIEIINPPGQPCSEQIIATLFKYIYNEIKADYSLSCNQEYITSSELEK